MKHKGRAVLEKEAELRGLTKTLKTKGIEVRRENLATGAAYRTKSGNCYCAGQDFIFVDRRLPVDQQVSLLVDYLLNSNLSFSQEELESLSDSRLSKETVEALQKQQVVAA